jgi:RNA polymerase II subunit A-like phosphatase
MTHDAKGIFLTKDEAARIEKETTDRLLSEKKLSLILDLDQTIIHATIDQKISQWKKDPSNPNYHLLDVGFILKCTTGSKEGE